MLFRSLKVKIKKSSDISTQPKGIEGIRILVEHHGEFEDSLLKLIESFPINTVGVWICTGWENSIKTHKGQEKLRNYLEKLKTNGTKLTQRAAETALN